jgi:large subunit ribosomal protein L24
VGRIKKNDTVILVAGDDAGKTGKVLQVLPVRGRAVVEGLNLVKKTLRKSQDNPQGGIAEKESSVELSNMMLYCTNCKKGVRTRNVLDGTDKARKCVACGHSFDG